MARLKSDSFSAYLEAKQRSKSGKSSAQTPSAGTPLSLLNTLSQASGHQMPVTELMAASGMSFPDFAEALKSLRESGYLTLSGPPTSEMATLTQLGSDAAQLARPR